MSAAGYYQHQIFFCVNQRENGEDSCARQGATAGFEHCRKRVAAERLGGPGGVRVNTSSCLNRCAGGPVAVVYPDAVWYTFVDSADIDEIVDSHLKQGTIVQRLLLAPDVGR